ncbi:unknown [Spodoptera litura nucleopolyhedrovirus]|uniref:Pif-4 n=1 Tax=Spodoptera litura multicapsid nucleopolyhedrovirus TaxID=46242 RepID=Q91BE0_NPVST|nr:hypothetical protein [Spodoptera litura nucleopolyhedrovirus]AAL01769.1 unknown [Spodoptera litura nucleopolyhedrovirus]QHN73936.1 hypothetical protein [Spodoptera litura nucleopolyhedrovirus]
MVSTLIWLGVMVCLIAFVYALSLLNPYRNQLQKLIDDHADTTHFGVFVDVFDLSLNENNIERLLLVRPENVIVYNVGDVVYYYLESGSVLCPREFAVVRFTSDNIASINENGVFDTICTGVNSLSLIEHFMTLKQGVPDVRAIMSVETGEINYSIMDIINYMIHNGLVKM